MGKKVNLDFKFLLRIQVRKCHLFAYYLFSLLFTKMTKHETFIFQFCYYPFSLVAIYISVYNTGQINYHHQFYETLFRRQYYVKNVVKVLVCLNVQLLQICYLN